MLYQPIARGDTLPAGSEFSLSGGEVALWVVDPGRYDERQVAQFETWLSEDERARSRRYRMDAHRRRDIICRALLRQLFCSYLGRSNDDLHFERTANGKPVIRRPVTDIQFNYSHSGERIAYAFVRGPDIGVDIEYAKRNNDLLAISTRYFSEMEVAALAAQPPDCHRALFFAYWTLKEAYIKARGEGIFLGLDRFSFQLDELQSGAASISFSSEDFDTPAGWQFFRHQPEPDYPVAIAVRGATGPLRLRCCDIEVLDRHVPAPN